MNEDIKSLLVGVWAPVDGNPRETITYRNNGTASMVMFGGLLHMNGGYSFIEPDVIKINWYASPSAEAEEVINAVNESGEIAPASVRIVKQSVMRIQVTEDELKTLHLEKGRVGHFYRVYNQEV